MAKNYDLIKAEFIEFLTNPEKTETQGDFAKRHGVDQATLSQWKAQPEFRKRFISRLEEYITDIMPDVYKTMGKKAKDGDYNWGKLAIQQANLLKTEKQELEITLPKPIYGGLSVQGYDSNQEDIQPQEED